MNEWPEDCFEQCWKIYPRKVGKGDARKSLERVNKKTGIDFETILHALEGQISIWRSEGRKIEFVPHLATWLNQQRWDDEPLETEGLERFNSSVRRTYPERDARGAFRILMDSEEWVAWCHFLGRSPPHDSEFGWYFPSRWPPAHPPEY